MASPLAQLIEQTQLRPEARTQLRALILRLVEFSGTPTDGTTLFYDAALGHWVPGAATSGATTNQNRRAIYLVLDGGGQAIQAGAQAEVRVPFSGTITGWELLADVSGSIVIDVRKETYANLPPTGGDSIAGTEKPTLSSAIKNQDLTLTTWTVAVTAGDWIGFYVDSASVVTRAALSILVDASS